MASGLNGLSAGELGQLGNRLRTATRISDHDLALLQRLRREYDEALTVVQGRIEGALPGAKPTTRLKTVQTLVEKLQRYPTMHLHQVQDVAGTRIVRPMSLAEQDGLVAQVVDLFPGSKVVDRRPSGQRSEGYRAVHVIAKVEGRLVEIQVRTTLQDRWAQIVERLGDEWGRQIRYGSEPLEPESPIGPMTRGRVWQFVQTISEFIAYCEEDEQVRCDAAVSALKRLSRLMAMGRVS